VRITADCPLVDPRIIDRIVGRYFASGADYCSNTIEETFPDGQDVEVFGFDALCDARENARLISEREHVTPYIRKKPAKFKLVNVSNNKDLGHKRWTVDTKEDFMFIKTVLGKLYKTNPEFSMEDVLDFLESYPEVEAINSGIIRNEGYLKSLELDKTKEKGTL